MDWYADKDEALELLRTALEELEAEYLRTGICDTDTYYRSIEPVRAMISNSMRNSGKSQP